MGRWGSYQRYSDPENSAPSSGENGDGPPNLYTQFLPKSLQKTFFQGDATRRTQNSGPDRDEPLFLADTIPNTHKEAVAACFVAFASGNETPRDATNSAGAASSEQKEDARYQLFMPAPFEDPFQAGPRSSVVAGERLRFSSEQALFSAPVLERGKQNARENISAEPPRSREISRFACWGAACELPNPGVFVSGYGVLPLPLKASSPGTLWTSSNEFPPHIAEIISRFEKAPYGHGSATVTDDAFRLTYQLPPLEEAREEDRDLASRERVPRSAVSANQPRSAAQSRPCGFRLLNGKAFGSAVAQLIEEKIAPQLQCCTFGEEVEARLYKLLVYTPGGHFKKHQDTQKFPGMFATLVIQLPSEFSGGKVTCRHEDASEALQIDMASNAAPARQSTGEDQTTTDDIPVCAAAAAKFYSFYCDVEHEVAPVEAGFRCALVYGLCWSGVASILRANLPFSATEEERMVGLLKQCASTLPQFCWKLSNTYSAAELAGYGWVKPGDRLRGKDKSLVKLLLLANKKLPEGGRFAFQLAQVRCRFDADMGEYSCCIREVYNLEDGRKPPGPAKTRDRFRGSGGCDQSSNSESDSAGSCSADLDDYYSDSRLVFRPNLLPESVSCTSMRNRRHHLPWGRPRPSPENNGGRMREPDILNYWVPDVSISDVWGKMSRQVRGDYGNEGATRKYWYRATILLARVVDLDYALRKGRSIDAYLPQAEMQNSGQSEMRQGGPEDEIAAGTGTEKVLRRVMQYCKKKLSRLNRSSKLQLITQRPAPDTTRQDSGPNAKRRKVDTPNKNGSSSSDDVPGTSNMFLSRSREGRMTQGEFSIDYGRSDLRGSAGDVDETESEDETASDDASDASQNSFSTSDDEEMSGYHRRRRGKRDRLLRRNVVSAFLAYDDAKLYPGILPYLNFERKWIRRMICETNNFAVIKASLPHLLASVVKRNRRERFDPLCGDDAIGRRRDSAAALILKMLFERNPVRDTMTRDELAEIAASMGATAGASALKKKVKIPLATADTALQTLQLQGNRPTGSPRVWASAMVRVICASVPAPGLHEDEVSLFVELLDEEAPLVLTRMLPYIDLSSQEVLRRICDTRDSGLIRQTLMATSANRQDAVMQKKETSIPSDTMVKYLQILSDTNAVVLLSPDDLRMCLEEQGIEKLGEETYANSLVEISLKGASGDLPAGSSSAVASYSEETRRLYTLLLGVVAVLYPRPSSLAPTLKSAATAKNASPARSRYASRIAFLVAVFRGLSQKPSELSLKLAECMQMAVADEAGVAGTIGSALAKFIEKSCLKYASRKSLRPKAAVGLRSSTAQDSDAGSSSSSPRQEEPRNRSWEFPSEFMAEALCKNVNAGRGRGSFVTTEAERRLGLRSGVPRLLIDPPRALKELLTFLAKDSDENLVNQVATSFVRFDLPRALRLVSSAAERTVIVESDVVARGMERVLDDMERETNNLSVGGRKMDEQLLDFLFLVAVESANLKLLSLFSTKILWPAVEDPNCETEATIATRVPRLLEDLTTHFKAVPAAAVSLVGRMVEQCVDADVYLHPERRAPEPLPDPLEGIRNRVASGVTNPKQQKFLDGVLDSAADGRQCVRTTLDADFGFVFDSIATCRGTLSRLRSILSPELDLAEGGRGVTSFIRVSTTASLLESVAAYKERKIEVDAHEQRLKERCAVEAALTAFKNARTSGRGAAAFTLPAILGSKEVTSRMAIVSELRKVEDNTKKPCGHCGRSLEVRNRPRVLLLVCSLCERRISAYDLFYFGCPQGKKCDYMVCLDCFVEKG